jgi:hypothetical protein
MFFYVCSFIIITYEKVDIIHDNPYYVIEREGSICLRLRKMKLLENG